MGKISELQEDLLVKILSFLPTKEAVSTSILSKQWEFLWRWIPNLEYDIGDFESTLAFREYMNKNLPLHRAHVIEKFSLQLGYSSVRPNDIKMWVRTVVSRCVRELTILYPCYECVPRVVLPTSVYTCELLVTLILSGRNVFVDFSSVVSLPSLKTLELLGVMYSNEYSIQLLLSSCLVLEDLVIERDVDNLRELVVTAPLLQRLSAYISPCCSSDGVVIDTPSLKYLKFHYQGITFPSFVEHMPKIEEADIYVEVDVVHFLYSITSVKRLSISSVFYSGHECHYTAGINVFNQLEYLKLHSQQPKLLFGLLEDSPKLRDLYIYDYFDQHGYAPFSLNNISVPKCLLESLESFKFEGYKATPVEREFLSFFFRNASCLKSSSISK